MKSRFTVIEQLVHYSDVAAQPQSFEGLGFGRLLESACQAYSRSGLRVTSEWQPLSKGWLEDEGADVGQLVLRNDEGRHLQQNPTDEDKAALAKQIIIVGLLTNESKVTPFAQLLPGESLRFTPWGWNDLRVRSSSQEDVRATIICIPR